MQEVVHDDLLMFGSNTGFKWNQREGFTEERIDGLDVWDDCSRRASFKGLEIIEDDFHAV